MKSMELSGEARFLQLASNAPECYWLIDVETRRVTYVSKGYEQIWGRHVKAFYDDPDDWLEYLHPGDRARFERDLKQYPQGGLEAQVRVVRPDGSVRSLHIRTFPVCDESQLVVSVGGVASDVTNLLGVQSSQPYFAHFDALTALPNQLMFYDQARRLLALTQRKGLPLCVMVIDIDRFREVNQMLGHLCGDELLRQVAKRLQASVRESDVLGRLGGDVFAMLLTDVSDSAQATVVARRLTDTLALPVTVEGRDVFVTASIGVVFHPQDGHEVHELITHAEMATRHAKATGRNGFQFFTSNMQDDVRDRLFLETDLHNAVLRDEFVLYYQPKVSCQTGQITGAEALIRWNHPTRGVVPPDQFISMLEETGLIVPVGRWALEMACTQVMAWRTEGVAVPSVSVNLSARQLQSDSLISDVAMALSRSGLDPASLDLEITESMLMHDADRAVFVLNALKKTGVTLSLDDFGTGYSSLAYLKRFPLDALKVDRSFVQDIAADTDDASITRAVITMAHHLKLKVVAEGVETAEQLALLMSHHCDMIQGYFFSRPLPIEDMGNFLAADPRLPASLLRSDARQPTALFVTVDGFDDLKSDLCAEGYRVSEMSGFDSALLWLAGNMADVMICGSPRPDFDGIALLKRAAQMQGHCERIMLVDDLHWHSPEVADLSSNGVAHRVLHLPVDPQTLRGLLEDCLVKRHISDEHHRLSLALTEAERNLLQAGEEKSRLLSDNRALQQQEKLGYELMQEVLAQSPWPVIGLASDGLVAMANEAALAQFAVRGLSIGIELAQVLPEVSVDERQTRIALNGAEYLCWSRPIRTDGAFFGRLLFLQKVTP